MRNKLLCLLAFSTTAFSIGCSKSNQNSKLNSSPKNKQEMADRLGAESILKANSSLAEEMRGLYFSKCIYDGKANEYVEHMVTIAQETADQIKWIERRYDAGSDKPRNSKDAKDSKICVNSRIAEKRTDLDGRDVIKSTIRKNRSLLHLDSSLNNLGILSISGSELMSLDSKKSVRIEKAYLVSLADATRITFIDRVDSGANLLSIKSNKRSEAIVLAESGLGIMQTNQKDSLAELADGISASQTNRLRSEAKSKLKQTYGDKKKAISTSAQSRISDIKAQIVTARANLKTANADSVTLSNLIREKTTKSANFVGSSEASSLISQYNETANRIQAETARIRNLRNQKDDIASQLRANLEALDSELKYLLSAVDNESSGVDVESIIALAKKNFEESRISYDNEIETSDPIKPSQGAKVESIADIKVQSGEEVTLFGERGVRFDISSNLAEAIKGRYLSKCHRGDKVGDFASRYSLSIMDKTSDRFELRKIKYTNDGCIIEKGSEAILSTSTSTAVLVAAPMVTFSDVKGKMSEAQAIHLVLSDDSQVKVNAAFYRNPTNNLNQFTISVEKGDEIVLPPTDFASKAQISSRVENLWNSTKRVFGGEQDEALLYRLHSETSAVQLKVIAKEAKKLFWTQLLSKKIERMESYKEEAEKLIDDLRTLEQFLSYREEKISGLENQLSALSEYQTDDKEVISIVESSIASATLDLNKYKKEIFDAKRSHQLVKADLEATIARSETTDKVNLSQLRKVGNTAIDKAISTDQVTVGLTKEKLSTIGLNSTISFL